MLSWEQRIALRALVAILSAIAVAWLALLYFIPAPPSTITIVAGIKNGVFSEIAEHYRARLASEHVRLNIRTAENASTAHLKLLEDPNSAVDAAFLFGGVSNGKQSPNLLSLGRIMKCAYLDHLPRNAGA